LPGNGSAPNMNKFAVQNPLRAWTIGIITDWTEIVVALGTIVRAWVTRRRGRRMGQRRTPWSPWLW
jgi:hypothetical protein